MYRFIPDKLLNDKKGYPTKLSLLIYRVQVKLRLREPILISKEPIKFMWGDKEITPTEIEL